MVVGGGVRDGLLGRRPPTDWDLATSASPRQVRQVCPSARTDTTSHTDLTLCLLDLQDLSLQITPFRESHNFDLVGEMDYDAVASTLELDLAGRDYTVNAMAYDPLEGTLHDPHGGRRDLELRLVRALPDPMSRLAYDPVRILRGIRIAEKLQFEIEAETLAAMKPSVSRVDTTSYRVYSELDRIMGSVRPAWCLERLREIEGVGAILAPLQPSLRIADPILPDRTVWDTMLRALWLQDPPSARAAWASAVGAAIVANWLAGGDARHRELLSPRDPLAHEVAAMTVLAFRNHFPNRAMEDPLTAPSPLDDPPGIERLALEVVAWPQDVRSAERAREAGKATRYPWSELWKPLTLLWTEARSNTW